MGENLELSNGILCSILENQITNDDNVLRDNNMNVIYVVYNNTYRLLLPCKELLKFMVDFREVSCSTLKNFISFTLLQWLGYAMKIVVRTLSNIQGGGFCENI